MRYYLQYIEQYLPKLKYRYKAALEQDNLEKQLKILIEVRNNIYLTDKQKKEILNEIENYIDKT